ncbi:MAG: hypothetical protein ABI723_25170 [Bacteroidia bacterium]
MSIHGVIEGLTSSELPALIPDLCIVVLFERDVKKDPPKIEVIAKVLENKKSIIEQPIQIDFKEGNSNRTVLNIPFLHLEEYGKLMFEFWVKKQKVASYFVNFTQGNGTAENDKVLIIPVQKK